MALLIAAQCPASPTETGNEGDGSTPPQPPYQRVVRLYANAFLQSGTPLHTLALAFSGQAEAAIKHGGKSLGGPMGVGGDGSLGQGGFKDTWMATAAAILSNKVLVLLVFCILEEHMGSAIEIVLCLPTLSIVLGMIYTVLELAARFRVVEI